MPTFLHRLRARLRNRGFDNDLLEELRVHEQMKREELIGAGAAPHDAHAAARRALGNVTLMREDARRVWIAPWLEGVMQDARYAVRTLARQPLHTGTVLAVLVLAIGLNSSLFTLLKGVLLTPWPGRGMHRVVQIKVAADGREVSPSVDEYRFYQQHAASFSGLAVSHGIGGQQRLRAPGRAEVFPRSAFVSANFLDVLAGRMHLGTGFEANDDRAGQRAVAVLSHFVWRNQFDSDPGIVGLPVTLNGQPFTIIGVTEERIDGLRNEVGIWLPLSALAGVGPVTAAGVDGAKSAACCVSLIGRLSPDADRSRARLELQQLHERFAESRKLKRGRVDMFGTSAVEGPAGADLGVLGAISAALALILILACANVGNLQLARGLARRREFATRQAIGASRSRIVRQLLVEGLVLSLGAGTMAIAAAAMLPGALMRVLGDEIPAGIAGRFAPDWTVIAFTAAVCLLACLAFALAPALQTTRATIPLGVLDRAATRRTRLSLRGVFLAAQIAACTALLVGGGLLTRGVMHAMAFDPGYEVAGIIRVRVTFPSEMPDTLKNQLQTQLLTELERIDEPAAVAHTSPVARFPYMMSVLLPSEQPSDHRRALRRNVSREFFDVLGIPLVSGRMFESGATGEIVVNETFVRSFCLDRPVGVSLREVDGKGAVVRTHAVVGVVRDAYLNGFDRIDPMIFRPTPTGPFMTAGGPAAVERIRAAALALHPGATILSFPMTDDVRKYLEESRMGAACAWAIGILGLLLASVGVFGVFAYAVEERRREIGVRLALGGARTHIVHALVASSGKALLIGLVIGLLASLACGPLLGSYLYGLSPLDPLAYAGVLALLATTALLATAIPARRAIRVDPAVTLRED